MKKLLSLLGVFIFIGCLQSYASKREIYMDLSAYGTENWDFPDPSCPFAPDPYHDVYIK